MFPQGHLGIYHHERKGVRYILNHFFDLKNEGQDDANVIYLSGLSA